MNGFDTRDIVSVIRERVASRDSQRIGVVIGVNVHRRKTLNLRYARPDADLMYELMVDSECGMFPKENVTLLLDENATRESVRLALASLPKQVGKNDTLWIYFAGHAACEEDSVYWICHDSDVNDLTKTGMPKDEILMYLDKVKASRMVVFLDCCHAKAISMQRNRTRSVVSAEHLLSRYDGTGRVILASSDSHEQSVELEAEGHGAFTHFLCKGLRGEADQDNEGVVTVESLWKYLNHKVYKASTEVGKPQHPVRQGDMTHDYALTLNPVAVGRKKDIDEAVRNLHGLDRDHLADDEVRFCLELLREGAKTKTTKELANYLDTLPDANVYQIKALIKDAQKEGPPAPSPTPSLKDPVVYRTDFGADASGVKTHGKGRVVEKQGRDGSYAFQIDGSTDGSCTITLAESARVFRNDRTYWVSIVVKTGDKSALLILDGYCAICTVDRHTSKPSAFHTRLHVEGIGDWECVTGEAKILPVAWTRYQCDFSQRGCSVTLEVRTSDPKFLIDSLELAESPRML